MNISKNIKFNLTLLIIFILYTIIVMLIFHKNTYFFWTSYLFTLIAFVLQFLLIYYLTNKNSDGELFNNLPLIMVSNLYFFIQIIISILFLVFKNIGLNLSIVVQTIILGLFIITEISLSRTKDHIISVDENNKNQTLFLTKMKIEIEILSNNIDLELKKDFNNLFDVIRYSNPVTNKESVYLEEKILSSLNELKIEIYRNDKKKILNILKELEKMMSERETLLKK